ncbi:MAG: hypothetical protein FJY85_09505, partial [Deltaproteobacteria bacterium]|nr:hypothetical protein [Deltaproteobacteria bacterium]
MFFLFGLVSLTGQVLLLRELLVIFHGTEISVGIFFGSWLAGIGIGAAVGAWLVKAGKKEPLGVFLHCMVALGFSVLFQICLIRLLPMLFGIAPAELTPLHGILIVAPVGTLTSSFLTGFLFPVGCKTITQAGGRAIGHLYAFEGLGGLIGGLAFTFMLVRYLPPLRIAAVLAAVVALAVMVYCMCFKVKAGMISSAGLLCVALALLSPLGDSFLQWTIRIRWESLHPGLVLLQSKSTPYQQVEIGSLGKQRSFFGNGKIVSSFPDPHA